jgi:anaerobic ribonucleoside-triphosphate reductase
MIKELLLEKKPIITRRWVQSIIESYPQESSYFLASAKDRFGNPVGNAIYVGAEQIFDEITGGNDFDKIKSALGDIIKIRAVQDFSHSEAAGFIFSLKRIIAEELEKEFIDSNSFHEYLDIEQIIDRTALMAFDLYMKAKEKLFEIRVNEIKSRMPSNNRNGLTGDPE